MTVDGVSVARSSFGPAETIARLETEIAAKGMTVFANIDHAEGAQRVGLPLRPTTVLIFGSAKAGTPLMQATQLIGLDLPLKMLVWQDETGITWLGYTEPESLFARHGLQSSFDQIEHAMTSTLAALADAATTR